MRGRHLLWLVPAAALAACSSTGTSPVSVQNAPPSSAATQDPAETTAPASSASAAPVTATSGACTTAHLRLREVPGGGAAAGTSYITFQLVNTGTTTCRIGGYPGVSFLDASGAQVGQPADRDAVASPSVQTLAAGGHTSFFVGIPNPGNFPAGDCHVGSATTVRVYPPNQTQPLTAAHATQLCTTSAGRAHVSALGAVS